MSRDALLAWQCGYFGFNAWQTEEIIGLFKKAQTANIRQNPNRKYVERVREMVSELNSQNLIIAVEYNADPRGWPFRFEWGQK